MQDDPDVLMMKFLRARKYNVAAGVAMFCAMMKWRMESDVEKIVAKGEEGMQDAEGFIKQMSSGKTYVQGTDREGRPIVYIHVKLHRLMDQSAKALEGARDRSSLRDARVADKRGRRVQTLSSSRWRPSARCSRLLCARRRPSSSI